MQVYAREMTRMNSSGLQEIMSPALAVADTQALQTVLQLSSWHPAELTQLASQAAAKVQQSLSGTAREAQQQLKKSAQKKWSESLLEQASLGEDCQAYAHENLLAFMEQSMDAPTACDIVKSTSSSMPLDSADSNVAKLPLLETGGSQQHANELSSCSWAAARKCSDSTAEYYSNEMELY